MSGDDDSTAAQQNTVSIGAPAPVSDATARQLPAAIGGYRILRLLGEGGMGAVYEAEQEQPRRTVALKVIKAAWASPELIRRFEQESQALGRLHHPGIAQVYEAGSADTGFGLKPFFAMELLHGKPLTEYAEAQHLNGRQRLMLMIQVCEAVEHAHQRGIIHRDLKPGNILVDENGQPKILDFGLAHFTDSDTQATRQTDVGQLLGTLAYMSPEQVLADPLAIDARSDVYALGVILYELLAGKLPYTIKRQLHEAVQTIREQDASPLSIVNRAYRGDIETIVNKALEKNKARRYASAADLAADIRRHLEDQPITAQPPSASYQMQKFARRHKALVVGVAAVFVVLVAGVVASTIEAARARGAEKAALAAQQAATRDRDRAVKAEDQAEGDRNRAQASEAQALRDRNLALEQKKRADSEAATAAAINGFLQNDLLAQASAQNQSGSHAKPDPDLKVRTALDRAAARLSGAFDKQPEVEAAIRNTIGQTYGDLGLYPQSREQLQQALELQRRTLGPDNPKTLDTLNELGQTIANQGKLGEAEGLLHQALEISRRSLGPEHPATLRFMHSLAYIYQIQGKFKQAEALDTPALEISRRARGPEHAETLATTVSLANVYAGEGKYAQAESLFHQALEVQMRVLGPEHPSTLNSMTDLASVSMNLGKYARAEELYNQALEIERRVLGPEHPATLTSMNRLALNHNRQGKYAQAEALHSRVFEISRKALGSEHQLTLATMVNLGMDYEKQGKYEQAETLDLQSLELQRHAFGPEHPNTLNSMDNLAIVYAEEGKLSQAATLFSQVVEIERRVSGPEHPSTLRYMGNLAELLGMQGKYTQAEELYSQTLEIQRRVLGAAHPDTLSNLSDLAYMYQRQGQYDKAESYAVMALEGQRHSQGAEASGTMDAAADLALACQSQGKFAESQTLAREALEFDRKQRPDPWQQFRAESLLGASLAGQKKYAEAETLLLEGYQGMSARKEQMGAPAQYYLTLAVQWLAQLYGDWGKPDKADAWRQKLQAAASPSQ